VTIESTVPTLKMDDSTCDVRRTRGYDNQRSIIFREYHATKSHSKL